ncbi:hypothetical protein ACNKHT_11020 [Shigella flexneri]
MSSEKGERNISPVAFATGAGLDGGTAVVAVFGLPEIIVNSLLQSFGRRFHRHALLLRHFANRKRNCAKTF